MLEGKEKDLIRQRNETDETLQQLRSEIQTLREQTSQAKEEVDRTTRRASSDSEDQKKVFELKVKQLETRVNALEEEGKQKDKLIE